MDKTLKIKKRIIIKHVMDMGMDLEIVVRTFAKDIGQI